MKKTILLVEDEVLIAMAQKNDLEQYGYEVLTASSGKKAIDIYEQAHDSIDLILMDIDLGADIDGTETAQQILSRHDVPVVFLSSHSERHIVERTEKISSYGYVVKNSGITILDASIKMALKLHDANRKAKENESKYRSLFEMESDCLVLIEVDTGNMLEVNKSFLEHYGYSRDEVLKLSITDFSAEPEETRKSIQNKHDYIPLRWHIKKDGTVFPVEITANAFDYNGIKAHIAAIRDISDRIEKEREIRNREEQFSLVFQKSPYPIALTESTTGKIIDVNEILCSKTGYEKEEIIGKSTTELGFYSSEDRGRFISELMDKGFVDGLEMPFKARDRILYARMFANFIKSDDKRIIMTMFEDITERKQQEKDLILQSMVLDQISDNVTVTDLNGIVTYVNQAVEKTLGSPKSKIIGRPTQVYGEDPEKGATQKEIIEKTRKEGTWSFEVVNFDAENNEHIMDCHTQVVTDENGEPIALCGIATDVTETKSVMNKLRKEQQRFKDMAELLPAVIFELDLQMNLTYANEKAFELFGYTKEDYAKGINASNMIAPESQEKAVTNIVRSLSGEKLGLQEYLAIRKDGHTFPVLIHSSQVHQEGTVTGLRGILVDITERKQIEESLKKEHLRRLSILEGTNVGTWEWNVQTGETIFNEKWAQIIGYTLQELEPISIETWLNHTHPGDLEKSNHLLQKHFKGELDYYHCEARMKHKDGHYIWVLDRGKVMSWTEEGKPLWMYGTHSDITEQKRIEEELRIAYQEKILLLDELQHRAKNSFAMISSLVTMAETDSQTDETQSVLSNIKSRVYAISEMYDLLAGSHSVTEVELSNYLENVMDGLTPQYRSLTITRNLDSVTLPIKTAISVGLIVVELITNAIKHAFPDNEHGTISLSLESSDDSVSLEIRDNGIGIPADFDTTQSDSIGFKLVHALTSQLNGTLSMLTENGTQWLLEFPRLS